MMNNYKTFWSGFPGTLPGTAVTNNGHGIRITSVFDPNSNQVQLIASSAINLGFTFKWYDGIKRHSFVLQQAFRVFRFQIGYDKINVWKSKKVFLYFLSNVFYSIFVCDCPIVHNCWQRLYFKIKNVTWICQARSDLTCPRRALMKSTLVKK